MIYLVIKELASTAEDVTMVTSSIMIDTAVGSDVVYMANAIRALCRIIDMRLNIMLVLRQCPQHLQEPPCASIQVKNTLLDNFLENVIVLCQTSLPEGEEEDAGVPHLEEEFIIPAPALKATGEALGIVYVAFKRSEAYEPENLEAEASGFGCAIVTFGNNLKSTTKEIDPTTGEPEDTGYKDEYSGKDLKLQINDYLVTLCLAIPELVGADWRCRGGG